MKWISAFAPGYAPDGRPILSVLGKRTYNFANGKAAWYDGGSQEAFREKDEFFGSVGPQTDAVKHESDMVAFKPMTDVAVIGKALSPRGKKSLSMSVGLQIGAHAKIIKVTGNRKVFVTGTGFAFSDPEPYEEMPLHFGLAYGGKDDQSEPGISYVYPRNPVGKGFIVKNNPKALQDLELPNLEDPKAPLTPANILLQRFDQWKSRPEPAAMGFTGRNFFPRYTLAGLPPDEYQKAEIDRQRSVQKMPEIGTNASTQPPPPVPLMNPLFFNGGASGLCVPFLNGSETVKLVNLDRDAAQFTFNLPGGRPKAWLDVGEGREDLTMVMHTLTIDKESNRIHVVWRGCAYYGGPESMAKFTALEFGVED
jgi:hypothetical protein